MKTANRTLIAMVNTNDSAAETTAAMAQPLSPPVRQWATGPAPRSPVGAGQQEAEERDQHFAPTRQHPTTPRPRAVRGAGGALEQAGQLAVAGTRLRFDLTEDSIRFALAYELTSRTKLAS